MKLRFLVLFSCLVLAGAGMAFSEELFFVQLSDTHWGFDNPKVNPDYAGTLKKAIAEVNALPTAPDFIVFTGDETHTTNDPVVRRQRMTEFKQIITALKVQNIHFLPGEHDAGLDAAAAYEEFFGKRYYTFDFKGVHFIALDNVTAGSSLGDEQLSWLQGVLAGFDKSSQIIVFAHRPLLQVYTQWDWRTKDGDKALAHAEAVWQREPVLRPHPPGARGYRGGLHAVRGQGDDVPAARPRLGGQGPAPFPGIPEHPYQGLGFRTVRIDLATHKVEVTEYPIVADAGTTMIKISARLGEFDPDVIHLKKGEKATLEVSSADTTHGFTCPDLGIDTKIVPGTPVAIPVIASVPGEHDFFCSVFCGEGHENMVGKILVE